MADASRFPGLVLPFALVGGAAGWLSTNLLANPLVHLDPRGPLQPVAAFMATLCAAAAGWLIRRACAGKRYAYSLSAYDPAARPKSDAVWRHAAVVLGAGALTGVLVSWTCDVGDTLVAAGIATLCALVFLPVCLAVIAAGRRAQRGRLGSIVADSDRRAVYRVLALALGVTTLEALPDWAAAYSTGEPQPWPAFAALLAASLGVGVILAADLRARALADQAIARRHRDCTADAVDGALPRVDLGLGDELGASVAASSSPYRGVDRALALIHGSPERVRRALSRSVTHGYVSLAALALVTCLHAASSTPTASGVYESLRAARIAYTSPPEPLHLVR